MDAGRKYHVGGVRLAALEAAQATIDEQGHAAVSMTDIAVRLGVVPSALYRHYRNRSALLLAVADQAFKGLHQEMLQVIAHQPDPWKALEAVALTFLGFAARHDRRFRMMYDDDVINASDVTQHLPVLAQSYRMVLRLARQAQPQASVQECRLWLIGMWSVLFGYATMRSRGGLMPHIIAGLSEQSILQTLLNTALGRRPPPA